MIQTQIKLKLNRTQQEALEMWLLVLFRVWNWAIRKIELDGKGGIYYSKLKFKNLLANHSQKIGIPSHTIQGMLECAWIAWNRCYKKIAKKPKLKGKDKKLIARLYERLKNRRKEDNHKLSRKLVENCKTICFSKDNIRLISKKPKPKKKKNGRFQKSIRFGKSAPEAGHYQLRQMIAYKCTASGRTFKEIESKYSTMTCSHCSIKTGPTGKAGLSVRQWRCKECGTLHDRDRNAANNTLIAGLGTSLEIVA